MAGFLPVHPKEFPSDDLVLPAAQELPLNTRICLLATASLASAGMHGYNSCYLATSIGIGNLKTSPGPIQIDSIWKKDFNGIIERNTFRDGHLFQRDGYPGKLQTFEWNAGTLTTGAGDSFERYVLDGDRIVHQSNAEGLGASITYTAGGITRIDSASGSATFTTRDLFRGDSLISEMEMPILPGMWFPNRICLATSSTCTCMEDRDTLFWRIKPSTVEESKNSSLEAIYYTSSASVSSVRPRQIAGQPVPGGSWRADGTRITAPHPWTFVLEPTLSR